MPRLDLSKLSVNSPGILNTLRNCSSLVQPNQFAEYYPALIALANERDKSVRQGAIAALSETISRTPAAAKAFSSRGYLSTLRIDGDSLEFFNTVATLIPAELNSARDSIERVIHHYPREFLTIFANYAQKQGKVPDPWPILDLLHVHSKVFATPELADNFVSILAWLVSNLKNFAEGRGQAFWDDICEVLTDATDPEVIRACFCALVAVADHLSTVVSLPSKFIQKALADKGLSGYAITLLLHLPSLPLTREIVNGLLTLAQEHPRPILILLRLASSRDGAKSILQNQDWMGHALPTELDTVRLFAMILKHEDLRSRIAKHPGLVSFFSIALKDPRTISFIGALLRRIPFNADALQELSDSGFIRQFFDNSLQNEDQAVVQSAFIFASAIAERLYVDDLTVITDAIVDFVREGKLVNVALNTGLRLTKQAECVQQLNRQKLGRWLAKRKGDKGVGELAEQLALALTQE
jgi:hypothetical protein